MRLQARPAPGNEVVSAITSNKLPLEGQLTWIDVNLLVTFLMKHTLSLLEQRSVHLDPIGYISDAWC